MINRQTIQFYPHPVTISALHLQGLNKTKILVRNKKQCIFACFRPVFTCTASLGLGKLSFVRGSTYQLERAYTLDMYKMCVQVWQQRKEREKKTHTISLIMMVE